MSSYKTRIGIIGIVTLAEFYNSANHIVHTAMAAGNPLGSALTYPVCIDGMILAAVVTLIAKTGVNKMARFYAGWARVLGYVATVYCNVTASGLHSVTAGITDLFPGLGLIVVLELAIYSLQQTPAARARKSTVAKPVKLRSVG